MGFWSGCYSYSRYNCYKTGTETPKCSKCSNCSSSRTPKKQRRTHRTPDHHRCRKRHPDRRPDHRRGDLPGRTDTG
ncbi:MAG: hypothetical protein WCZ16_00700, partial [Desulfosarcinaceae bacterium]